MLRIAASLDALSQHPVALAVVAAWSERAGVELKVAHGPGRRRTHRRRECTSSATTVSPRSGKVCSLEVEAVLSHFEVQGKTTVVVASETVLGVIAVADTP